MHTPGAVDNKLQSVTAESFSINSEMLLAEIDNFLKAGTGHYNSEFTYGMKRHFEYNIKDRTITNSIINY